MTISNSDAILTANERQNKIKNIINLLKGLEETAVTGNDKKEKQDINPAFPETSAVAFSSLKTPNTPQSQ